MKACSNSNLGSSSNLRNFNQIWLQLIHRMILIGILKEKVFIILLLVLIMNKISNKISNLSYLISEIDIHLKNWVRISNIPDGNCYFRLIGEDEGTGLLISLI
jgi:hypothetical protein